MYVSTMPGLGDAASAARNVQIGGSIGAGAATAAMGTIAAHLATTGGSIIGLSSSALTAAIPIVGAGIAAATMLAQYLIANSGCGQTCIVTSQWANQAEDALRQNLEAYRAIPAPRTKTQQALALANFDTIWAQLREVCGQPGTGDAGRRCISDRQRGACTWKDAGECWDWFKGYRDPIANDAVVSDPSITSSVSGAVDQLFGGASGGLNLVPILIIGGLVLLAVKS